MENITDADVKISQVRFESIFYLYKDAKSVTGSHLIKEITGNQAEALRSKKSYKILDEFKRMLLTKGKYLKLLPEKQTKTFKIVDVTKQQKQYMTYSCGRVKSEMKTCRHVCASSKNCPAHIKKEWHPGIRNSSYNSDRLYGIFFGLRPRCEDY